MEVLIISMLIIAGLILFIIEVFLIPGISVAGIASACSLLYAIYYAFDSLGTQAGIITIGITIIGITGITIWFMKGKTVDKLALKQTLDYKPNPLKGVDIHVGDIGTTITRLTLIGNAEINGHILEVQSADGFIDEKTPIKVCRITPNTIYVQSIQ
ncbi:NfeD family protein [Phocaeicola acetigenes]|jgi:membrane-bound ClpP family serine protease|uniref:NfeD family protein n=1 Tax=Phocaeicola acetigenes TaxID=3016083 RepID=A0ABT4PE07_9BACT|nr:NfeD family protein [Phocaeicola sp. KGMB11183]MCZ8371268.1 NfeD family protein [Phocaeicola sp. KGMB11183]